MNIFYLFLFRSTHHNPPTLIKKTYLHDRKTNQRYLLNGCVPSTSLPEKACLRKEFSQSVKYSAGQLPPKVDLRPWMTNIENQKTVNTWLVKYLYVLF